MGPLDEPKAGNLWQMTVKSLLQMLVKFTSPADVVLETEGLGKHYFTYFHTEKPQPVLLLILSLNDHL